VRFLTEKLPNVHILLTTSKTSTDKLQHNTMGGWEFDKRTCRGNSEGFVHPPKVCCHRRWWSPACYDELGIFALIDRDSDAPQFFSPSLPFFESQPETGCNKMHQPCEPTLLAWHWIPRRECDIQASL